MNKAELVDAMAAKSELSKTDAEKALNAFIDSVQAAVTAGDKVVLPGFGSFSRVERSARMGRNPQTGQPVEIKASKSAKFSVGKKFKDQVSGN